MEILIFIIPFIVAIYLLIFKRKQTVWWEYVLLIVPSILIVLFLRFVMISIETSSTEYHGAYITKIRHEDKWNERVRKTRTKRIPSGRVNGHTTYTTVTETYYVTETHPDKWITYDNNGRSDRVNKPTFERIRDKWKTPMVFIDMHRNYHTIDGDAQEYTWNNSPLTIETRDYAHLYENRLKVSKSVFNFEDISDEEAKELGLFEYPKIINGVQNPILGLKNPKPSDIRKIEFINGYYGASKEFRTYVLFFYNQSIEISEKQRSYWYGGNKNEFITCVGLDSSNKIQWVNCFSWMDKPIMELSCESHFNNKDTFSVIEYGDWVISNLNLWKRKEFKDFNYLKVELSLTQYWIIFIISLIYCIGISWYIVHNEFEN